MLGKIQTMLLQEFHTGKYKPDDADHMATDVSLMASDAWDMNTRNPHNKHTLTTLAVSPAALEDLPEV